MKIGSTIIIEDDLHPTIASNGMKIADSYIRWNTPMWIDIPNHRNKDAISLKGETGELLYLGIVPAEHCAEMTDKRLFKQI